MDTHNPRSATPRFGRVEREILQKLRAESGLTQREDILHAAFPDMGPRPQGEPESTRWDGQRARAEATISRAIRSLEVKKLVRRQRNARTGRTLIQLAGITDLPDWERMARGEEDLAAHYRHRAREWSELARRAQARAERVRDERSYESTEEERADDLDIASGLEAGEP